MISKEEVKHIAKLARLGLTEKEIAKFQKELSSILDYIEKLKEVDISEVEPTSHSVLVENVIREDRTKSVETRFQQTAVKQSSKLLKLAPDIKDGYLKTKSIL
jgi:aspartyl-tRNA(Asn)/glutamyl-tRNA(Gln) amidotransferase subunit C